MEINRGLVCFILLRFTHIYIKFDPQKLYVYFTAVPNSYIQKVLEFRAQKKSKAENDAPGCAIERAAA